MATSTGRVPIAEAGEHHVGFNKALQKALDNMDHDFPKGTKHKVNVTFQLDEVEVNSPGSIGFYQVIITTS